MTDNFNLTQATESLIFLRLKKAVSDVLSEFDISPDCYDPAMFISTTEIRNTLIRDKYKHKPANKTAEEFRVELAMNHNLSSRTVKDIVCKKP